MRKRLYPHPALGVLLWLQYLRYSPLAPHHELLWQRHRLLQVGVRKDNKKSRGRPLLFIFISMSANISSICPPSSRVSPFCLRQSPTGRATLGSRTLSDVASLCHSLRWCKKNRAHPQLRTLVWCSALPSSSPLLLAFRHATSKCLYKNASNKPYVFKNAIF